MTFPSRRPMLSHSALLFSPPWFHMRHCSSEQFETHRLISTVPFSFVHRLIHPLPPRISASDIGRVDALRRFQESEGCEIAVFQWAMMAGR